MNTDLHSQAAAYIIGSLSPAEEAEFEAHLATCAACREEVAELQELTADMSEAVATDPPPHLRASILAQIATTKQDSPPARIASAPPVHVPEPRSGDNVIALRPSRRNRFSALLAAAAVVAAVGFGGWAWDNSQDAQRDADQYRQSAAAAQQQAQQMTSLLAASDVRTVPGTFVRGGSGKVVYSESVGAAVLVASGVPELPEGKVYEAWTIDGDTPVPAGTFTAGGDTALQLPDAALDAASIAVTVEAAGGVTEPTTDAVFSVNL